MSFSDKTEVDLLNHLFMKTALTQYTNLFIGLSSSTPAEDGTGVTEPSAGSYARVSTAGADWSAAQTNGGVSDISNSSEITFPTATADWLVGANLTDVLIYDAATGGNLVASGSITSPRPVLNGDTVRYTSGNLKISLD